MTLVNLLAGRGRSLSLWKTALAGAILGGVCSGPGACNSVQNGRQAAQTKPAVGAPSAGGKKPDSEAQAKREAQARSLETMLAQFKAQNREREASLAADAK